MLALRPGDRVLDIACGNGAFPRRLAEMGMRVLACDHSAPFIELARARSEALGLDIDYRAIDATDEGQLLRLPDQILWHTGIYDGFALRNPARRMVPESLGSRPDS